jgi:AraC-like DNA-binding protein
MLYKYIAPAAALSPFVRDYLIADFTFEKGSSIPYKPYSPKPEQTITFIPKGYLDIVNPVTHQTFRAPKVSICGQQVSRYNFFLPEEYLMIRVHFHPGGLYRLLRTPLQPFTDTWYDADGVVRKELLTLNDRLGNSRCYAEMIRVIENYLLRQITLLNLQLNPIDKVAAVIHNDPSRFSLDWLADQACLCSRQLNRKFTERMGIGPKLYSRVVRFYKAYQYREAHPTSDWLSIALKFGYTDYLHMVRDFKQFSHLAPGLWVKEDNRSPERILGLE